MRHERLVLDTSVLISAALQPRGKPAAALMFALRYSVLIFSKETYAEIAASLMRPKFDAALSREVRTAFLEDLFEDAEWVTITGSLQGCRDPKDDILLETAIVGRAGCLVSSDGDLLAMRPAGEHATVANWEAALHRGIAIMRPGELLRGRANEPHDQGTRHDRPRPRSIIPH